MCNILIVEDELIEQKFLESIVLEEICNEDKVITCGNGLEAIKLAKKYCPDIIFMDVIIPELDGLSALKEIKKFLPEVYVIVLSAHSDFYYAQEAINLHVIEYLLKPVKPSIFRKSLRNLLEKTAARDRSEEIITDTSTDKHSIIELAITYINENYKEKLTLQMVAAHVYLNPQYFSRIFKKEVGVTYTDFVNNLKILHACRLLKDTNYPAYRISSECGFTDASYFNRVFVQQLNMTPKEYKRKNSK